MKPSYDAAVIGIGTMGSFTACELARRGLRVLGLDAFTPPHQQGSHSGETRIFRIAYAEHPNYVPLALRAGQLWDELTPPGEAPLLTRNGLLTIGAPGGANMQGTILSAEMHNLELLRLTKQEVERNFPAFTLPEEYIGLFEPSAGWIDVNRAIQAALRLAEAHGATLRCNEPVLEWKHVGSHFEITAAAGTYTAEKLVLTAGAWTTPLLRELGLPLEVQRKVLTWVDPIDPSLFQSPAFPVFVCGEEFLYGFPAIDSNGVKLAIHWSPGQIHSDPGQPVAQPSLHDAEGPLAADAKLLPRLAGPLPHALDRIRQMKTCFYTMTPDEHFILDRHPEFPALVFAAGFSGHGFKFAPAIAEVLADLALTCTATLPVEFLSMARLAGTQGN